MKCIFGHFCYKHSRPEKVSIVPNHIPDLWHPALTYYSIIVEFEWITNSSKSSSKIIDKDIKIVKLYATLN